MDLGWYDADGILVLRKDRRLFAFARVASFDVFLKCCNRVSHPCAVVLHPLPLPVNLYKPDHTILKS